MGLISGTRWERCVRVLACLLLSLALGGCSARGASARVEAAPDTSQSDSLEVFTAKVRALSARAAPEAPILRTVEATDPGLRDALAAHLAAPSAATARPVAEAYARLDIFDRAHQFYQQILQLQPDDAGAHDGLARLWRDAGFPHLGLPDSHRAVFYAPDSPIARNTLGTVLQALGHWTAARQEYERALALDPGASYALNNLCYGWLLDGEPARAIDACRSALRLQPGMHAARNNLALAFAATGDDDAARAAFAEAGTPAQALFNTGILHMARREYSDAMLAFVEAHSVEPSLSEARARAHQAAAHLSAANEE